MISEGSVRASEEVLVELEKRHDGATEWARAQVGLFVPIDDEVQDSVTRILNDHPKLIDTRRGRSGADPFVIGLAESAATSCTVITGELPSNNLNRPKIPDVCGAMGVPVIRLVDLIRLERWSF